MEFIYSPWPWYVAGPLIALIMFALLYSGKKFGLSSNLRSMCAMLGAGKHCDFFAFDWKSQSWNLVFLLGLVIGGFIATTFMGAEGAHISASTIAELESYGIVDPGKTIVPIELFGWDKVLTTRGLIAVVLGGFLVGFGARYTGGCTSGHAISGLSDLQLPSLIAVVGFFIGGLLIIYFVTPHLFSL